RAGGGGGGGSGLAPICPLDMDLLRSGTLYVKF
ncbi:unnamed protein product, partial [Rotaria socialis]